MNITDSQDAFDRGTANIVASAKTGPGHEVRKAESEFPPAPSVGLANTQLRAKARDAAWWLHHYSQMDLRDFRAQEHNIRRALDALAKSLTQAVLTSNSALDYEAFGREVK